MVEARIGDVLGPVVDTDLGHWGELRLTNWDSFAKHRRDRASPTLDDAIIILESRYLLHPNPIHY